MVNKLKIENIDKTQFNVSVFKPNTDFIMAEKELEKQRKEAVEKSRPQV